VGGGRWWGGRGSRCDGREAKGVGYGGLREWRCRVQRTSGCSNWWLVLPPRGLEGLITSIYYTRMLFLCFSRHSYWPEANPDPERQLVCTVYSGGL
jgi:hypothetical protein